MLNSLSRTELLLGHPAMEALKHARVAVFGIGGVGGYACEALVRSGVGAFDLIDDDKVCLTNINRQIIATRRTVGQYKADVMRDRMLDINPQADIRVHRCFFLPENAAEFPFSEYDYILDAVDTVSAKLSLAVQAQAAGVPIISAMGAGNKLDASRFRISDISETRVCPLARGELEFGYGIIPLADVNQGGDFLDRVVMIRRQIALDVLSEVAEGISLLAA